MISFFLQIEFDLKKKVKPESRGQLFVGNCVAFKFVIVIDPNIIHNLNE